ncbi:hypothetical protein [Streptomyces sp. NPDC058424]|uniref:hypothetical protein n=1 Tax=Streptomyces sp. NPDC058424 TaxID=3346491 RepID=UPI0036630602
MPVRDDDHRPRAKRGEGALRESDDADSVVTMTTESWALLTDAVKAGEYDITA